MFEKKSLFNSIELQEHEQRKDTICQMHANRVGIVLKVLLNRDLKSTTDAFLSKLDQLVKDTCNDIDNELCKTETDN